MSRNEKIGIGSTLGVATIVLTIIAMASGGAIKCGKIEEAILNHEKRIDKVETAVEILYRLDGKMDIVLEHLKDE